MYVLVIKEDDFQLTHGTIYNRSSSPLTSFPEADSKVAEKRVSNIGLETRLVVHTLQFRTHFW